MVLPFPLCQLQRQQKQFKDIVQAWQAKQTKAKPSQAKPGNEQ